MAYLVDTSVLIGYLGGKTTEAVERFHDVIALDIPFGITAIVYLEVLQGASSQATFDALDTFLSDQVFYAPRDPITTHRDAAHLSVRCRRHGVSPRSVADCLIAAIAIEHDLVLLHDDRDYVAMARVIPELKLA
ncbi:MAG: PIN domain-containing protein [Chloroflexota bacterium]|nr:PIN domain-containing protein [Chloroflexota bacterium]